MLVRITGCVLRSRERDSSQRAVRMCVCVGVGKAQYKGRARSLTQVPASLCEPDETRRLHPSSVAYCGHANVVRASARSGCVRVGAVTYSGQDAFFDAGTVTLGIETRHLRGSSVAYYASCCGHARAVRASVWSGRVCAWLWATYRCGIGRVRCAQEGDTRCLSPSSVVYWTGLCFLLRSRERGSSQRGSGCVCVCMWATLPVRPARPPALPTRHPPCPQLHSTHSACCCFRLGQR